MSLLLREITGDSYSGGGDEGASSSTSSSGGEGGDGYLNKYSYSSVIEIEEEKSSELSEMTNGIRMASIREEDSSLFSYDHFQNGGGDDVVYVAVGKNSSESSMDALAWTINHAVNPSTSLLFLIQVFPEIRHIPTPLGKLPISQVNPEQKENYMNQERSKRREFLQKFIDKCSASQETG